jgi:hypothetical protein
MPNLINLTTINYGGKERGLTGGVFFILYIVINKMIMINIFISLMIGIFMNVFENHQKFKFNK